MRKNFTERLWLIIKKRFNGKWTQLAKKAKISPGSFKRYLDGSAKPGFEQIVRICDASNTNPTWLLTGQGEMFIKPADKGDEVLSPELIEALKSHPTIEKIVLLLKDMDEDKIQEIFNLVQEKKLLMELLKERYKQTA